MRIANFVRHNVSFSVTVNHERPCMSLKEGGGLES